VVLHPFSERRYRLLVVGRKRLPDPDQPGDGVWAFVARVSHPPEPDREEQEEKGWLPDAHPAGQGVYAIVGHHGHTHLVYTLELSEAPGPLLKELGVREEGSLIVQVWHFEVADRRFAPLDPPSWLDHEGTKVVLLPADESVAAELGIALDREREAAETDEVLRELRSTRQEHPTLPLFTEAWA
jgi:hypothetical protein